jgi:RNA polymerase sigma-70 factor (ECF subfamily)
MARSPERQFLSHVSSVEVREAVDRLPQDFRTVLLLADVEQFSYREIAEMVGCPIGTVMSRLFRARRLVQRMLIETDRTQEVAGAAAERSRSSVT